MEISVINRIFEVRSILSIIILQSDECVASVSDSSGSAGETFREFSLQYELLAVTPPGV